MRLLKCAIYLALTGTVGFFAGRIIPKRWLKPGKGWFRSFAFPSSDDVRQYGLWPAGKSDKASQRGHT